jgi:hypothetical protein
VREEIRDRLAADGQDDPLPRAQGFDHTRGVIA